MSTVQVLRSVDYRRERWRNGAGWTREITRCEVPDRGLLWRLSIAELTRDSRYSLFPGFDRIQVLLRGNGLDLLPDAGSESAGRRRALEPPHGSAAWPGEDTVDAHLREGTVEVLNVFALRGAFGAEVLHRPMVGSMVFFPADREVWALHVLSGDMGIAGDGGEPLRQGDTAMLGGVPGEARRVPVEGAGELLAIRLAPAA